MSETSSLTLAEIEDAIRRVLQNQSVTLLGRTVTRANLGELKALRKEILTEQGRNAGRGRAVARFGGWA